MSEWISVNERLPELNEEVLVYVHGIGHNCGPYSMISMSNLTEWYSEDFKVEGIEWGCKLSLDENVSHWMPLPEPPEEI